MPKKCESCLAKRANFGLPDEGTRRWCGGCAKEWPGAIDVVHKKCDDCKSKLPSFGLINTTEPKCRQPRWCSGCARRHPGAVDLGNKKCEDCGLRAPKFGLPNEVSS
jgi:hypothetical protein